MADPKKAPSALRALSRFTRRTWPAFLLLAALGGCKHHRQSMRPVYMSPAPTAIVEPACPPGQAGCAPGSTIPSATEPAMPSIDSSLPASAGETSPPAASRAEEPTLSPSSGTTPGGSPNPPAERAPTATPIPPLNGPSASLGAPRRNGAIATTARTRQVALRNQVMPFVNDAGDLFAPPKADRPWQYIVLHHSAHSDGSYDAIDREHRQALGLDGCGYHFVIGNGSESPDGQIEVARRWREQKIGVHCRDAKNPDVAENAIGICFVGDFDNTPPTTKQIAAARALIAYLSDRYKIAPDRVQTHGRVASAPTSCPGKLFPVESILGSRHVAAAPVAHPRKLAWRPAQYVESTPASNR